MNLFNKKGSIIQKTLSHMHWPHQQTRAEKTLHLVHHFLIYFMVFLAGYFVALVQK